MISDTDLSSIIDRTLGHKANILLIPRELISFTGDDLNAAVVLNQIRYWTPRSTMEGGWIAKSNTDWTDETSLSRDKVAAARKYLEDRGLIETKLVSFRGKPTVHYRLIEEVFLAMFTEHLLSRIREGEKHCGKSAMKPDEGSSIAENPQRGAENPQCSYMESESTHNTPLPPKGGGVCDELSPDEFTGRAPRMRAPRSSAFDAFRAEYPHPKDGGDWDWEAAKKEWHRLAPDDTVRAAMMRALGNAKRSDKWKRGYVNNPAAFIRDLWRSFDRATKAEPPPRENPLFPDQPWNKADQLVFERQQASSAGIAPCQ